MNLLLNVTYEEKEKVKSLGAKWNPDLKKWYVPYIEDYRKFAKWILGEKDNVQVICEHFYIAEGVRECFRCRQNTVLIGFGVEKFFDFYHSNDDDDDDDDDDESCDFFSDEIHIASAINPLPKAFYDYLSKHYNYKMGYSKTVRDSYFANHCTNCSVIQGNFHVFHEVDTPFFIDSPEKAMKLTLKKIQIRNDFIADIDVGFGSEDWLIKEHSKIIDLDINFEF